MIEIFKTLSKKPHNREDGKAYCIVEINCDTGSELVGVTEIDNTMTRVSGARNASGMR